MVRRSRSTSFLVPIQAAGVSPIQILPENSNRELYAIQNQGVNPVYVSPNQNVTSAALSAYRGQEIAGNGGYVSDDMDQGCVYAIGIVAAAQIVVQETIQVQESKPESYEHVDARIRGRAAARTPFRRESRLM